MTMPKVMSEAENVLAEAKTLIGIHRYSDAVDLLQRAMTRGAPAHRPEAPVRPPGSVPPPRVSRLNHQE
jgi:hypothetical protein